MNKVAIVVGSSGQDGVLLTNHLRSLNYSVAGIDHDSDVSLADDSSIERFIVKHRPDELYYLAAYHHASQDQRETDEELLKRSRMVHVSGLRFCLDAIVRHVPKCRVFYASSSMVFGCPDVEVQDESTPLHPDTVYGITKAEGMKLCQEYRENNDIYTVSGILYNHESPLRKPQFLSRKVVLAASRIKEGSKEKLRLGDLESKVDWSDARDFVEAFHLSLQCDEAQDYIFSSGKAHTVRDFVETAFRHLGLNWQDHVEVDKSLLQRKKPLMVGNSNKLRKATGWRPKYDFQSMIEHMIESENKFLIFTPTLNEALNIKVLLKEISETKMPMAYDILVLDDHSPDGTGKILDELKLTMSNLYVIHKKNRNGIGGAHKDGIRWAYDRGYKTLVTMDADFTHPPQKIPELFQNIQNFDIVVGSRYIQKNSLDGWNIVRKFLTWTGHFLTTHMLGLKYDSTGAFRLYRLDKIHPQFFSEVQSNGYAFFFESLHLLNLAKYKINEMPISLPPRTYGNSKMSYYEVIKSLKTLFVIFFSRRKVKFEYTSTASIQNKT